MIDNFEWPFTGVCRPSDRDRTHLWELAWVRSWWNVPWCVGGNFNMVWFPSEGLGAEFFTPVMHEFPNIIADHSLLDLPLEGCAFMWSNSRRDLGLGGQVTYC